MAVPLLAHETTEEVATEGEEAATEGEEVAGCILCVSEKKRQ